MDGNATLNNKQTITFTKEQADKANKVKRFVENVSGKKITPNKFIKGVIKDIVEEAKENGK